ncbi:MAG: hypothetical protein IJ468_02520 [Lachnospiraceae bacterium]|nr:hypothetical protein [Lachnospiraceae bacterium]
MIRSITDAVKKIGILRILLMMLAGVVLILCSIPVTNEDRGESMVNETESRIEPEMERTYEEALENRLKNMLEQMEGVRSADVMITLAAGSRKIISRDEVIQEELESDASADGMVQNHRVSRSESTAVLTEQTDGSRQPYVLQEICPEILGILVLADADLTPSMKEEINGAVQALFQVEAHRIRVLEKKSSSEG